MTEVSFIIKFFFVTKSISWEDVLGKQFLNWFVKVEDVITSENDFIIYTDEDSDTQLMTYIKVTPDLFTMNEKYILVDFNGDQTQIDPTVGLFPESMSLEEARLWKYSEFRQRGNIYKHEVFRLKQITSGRIVLDDSYFRTSTIKFLHSTKEDYYALVKFKAILPN